MMAASISAKGAKILAPQVWTVVFSLTIIVQRATSVKVPAVTREPAQMRRVVDRIPGFGCWAPPESASGVDEIDASFIHNLSISKWGDSAGSLATPEILDAMRRARACFCVSTLPLLVVVTDAA